MSTYSYHCIGMSPRTCQCAETHFKSWIWTCKTWCCSGVGWDVSQPSSTELWLVNHGRAVQNFLVWCQQL